MQDTGSIEDRCYGVDVELVAERTAKKDALELGEPPMETSSKQNATSALVDATLLRKNCDQYRLALSSLWITRVSRIRCSARWQGAAARARLTARFIRWP